MILWRELAGAFKLACSVVLCAFQGDDWTALCRKDWGGKVQEPWHFHKEQIDSAGERG